LTYFSTVEIFGRDRFWKTIEAAQGDPARMRAILNELTIEQLTAFHYDLEDAVAELLDEPFTEYLTKDSEDGAIDVANWAVSQGRTYYEGLFTQPHTIPRDVEDREHGVLYDGITLTVYFDRTGTYPPYREDEDEDMDKDGGGDIRSENG
jgi:hypothetical protein